MIASATTSLYKLIPKPLTMSPTIDNSKVSKGAGQSIVFISTTNNDTGNSNTLQNVLKLKQNDLTDMSFKGENLQQLSTNALPPYVPVPPPIPVKKTYDVNCCCDCGDSFSLKSSLTFHLERRSVLIKFPCDTCKVAKIFYNRCKLLSHIRSHTDKNETADISRAVVNPLPRVFMDGLQTEIASALDEEELNSIDESSDTSATELLEFSLRETEDDSMLNVNNNHPESNGPKVKCLDCNEEFETAEARAKHLTNDDKIPLTTSQCNTCGMLCPSKCHLKAHQRLHLQVSPYVCPECGDSPDYYWNKFQHHVTYKCFHNARSIGYKCPACKRVSPTNQALLKHMELHTEKYLKCDNCIRAYTSLPRFEEHIKEFHYDPTTEFPKVTHSTIYKCSLCDIVFLTHDQMLMHRSTHLKDQVCEYVFNCMQCGKALESKALLLEHIKQSHAKVYKHFIQNEELENKPSRPVVTFRGKVECILCNTSFHSFQGYNVHLNRAHININQPCSYCYMIIGNRKEMVIHGKKHLKKGNVVCLLCNNKKCHDEINLEMHLSYHVNKLVNCSACPVCNELMPTSQKAMEHLRVEHSLTENSSSSKGGEGKSVTCHFCRISFDNDSDLQEHITTKHNLHQQKRPLNISAFQETEAPSPKKTSLKRNICAKCQFTSPDRKVFKEHILTHKTMNSTFQCQECGLCFIVESALVKHLRIIHKISDTKTYLEEEGCNYMPEAGETAEVLSCDSLICNVCYKTFPTETALKTHMRSHGMAFIQANKSNNAS